MKVFDVFELGEIVISTTNVGETRYVGDMMIVNSDSGPDDLRYTNHYGSSCVSSDKKSWRVATPSEQEYYLKGVRSIDNIPKSNFTNYEIY